MEPSLISDAEDDDTEMVKLRPERPNLQWKDGAFQDQTLLALNQMRKNRNFCDVTLQVNVCRQMTLYFPPLNSFFWQIGQQDIPAHRVVLAAASPYWMELFTSEDDQPTRKEVELDGGILYELNGVCSKDALERLVEYSYTSRLDIPGDQVKPVYMAAIWLKMYRVAAECARFMLTHLDLSSCLDLRSMPGIKPNASATNGHTVAATNGNAAATNVNDVAEDIDFVAQVDEFIELNFDRLCESRELRGLPRVCLEILHLSKEEKEQALARPLCELALDWLRGQWSEDESLTIDTLTRRVRNYT